jgi:hypothetical protein
MVATLMKRRIWIRIRLKGKIRIRIRVKSRIGIRVKVKSRILKRIRTKAVRMINTASHEITYIPYFPL